MPAYDYVAQDQVGKRLKGVLEGDTARHVRSQLRARGLIPLKVALVTQAGKRRQVLSGGRQRISIPDLALATRQMATLLSAGMPVDEVLSGVAQQTEKRRVASVLLGVRQKVLEGYTLAEAMDSFPTAFGKLYRITVASGERSGNLAGVLTKLADYTEDQHRIRQRIKQALVYPTLMTVVSALIVVFLLIYVVPQIITVFKQTNQALPFVTISLVNLSHFLQSYGIYLAIGLAVLIFGFVRAMRATGFRSKVHHIILRVPLIGRNLRMVNCARFGRTFGILNSASVPVLDAMTAAAKLISLDPMREAVTESIEKVREGAPIHLALEKTGYFPPMFLHLVASGEEGGKLELMLEKAASSLEQDVDLIIQNTLTLFEPVMILVMGAIVLYIVLAIMLPIFNLDQFSG